MYRVPPASTVGHRAEMWDVNTWLATVSLRVVQADDEAYVRLIDNKTGRLACMRLIQDELYARWTIRQGAAAGRWGLFWYSLPSRVGSVAHSKQPAALCRTHMQATYLPSARCRWTSR
jgi:hypothetical protein